MQEFLANFRGNMVEADPLKFGNMTVYIEWYNQFHVYYVSAEGIFIDSLPSIKMSTSSQHYMLARSLIS